MMKPLLACACATLTLTTWAAAPQKAPAHDHTHDANAIHAEIAALLKEGQDPFKLSGSSVTGNHTQAMDLTRHSQSIKVLGVFKLQGQAPFAMIQASPKAPAQIVKKQDVILVTKQKEPSVRTSTKQLQNVYFTVTDILDDAVMVAPQLRPQEVMTIR